MHRRTFIGSSVSGAVAAAVAAAVPAVARSSSKSQETAADAALFALTLAKQLEVKGDFQELSRSYHSDALLVEPSMLKPSIGRAAIKETISKKARDRKLVYFYYRQPQVVVFGSSALVVSNFESAYDAGDGKPVEYTGKSASVVLIGPKEPLIAQEVLVPNIQAGGYGPMGRALAPTQYGIYPLRALGPDPVRASSAGGGEYDVIYSKVRQIHDAWVAGDTTTILKHANKSGVFLIGDYSPFYVSGIEDVKQHFADFYKTSSVKFVRELDVTVRIWGDAAAVAFGFDLDYTINGVNRRSPGRGVYTFARAGATWNMASCTASHLVDRRVGDPYPVTSA